MFKLLLKILLIISFVTSQSYADEKQKTSESQMSYANYAIYTASVVASAATYVFLQYQFGGDSTKLLAMVAAGVSIYSALFLKETKGENTDVQTEDTADFVERFGSGRRKWCDGPSIGAHWNGNHAVLTLELESSDHVCRRYAFETHPKARGIRLADNDVADFHLPISKSDEARIQSWLVEFDRKNPAWEPWGNNCIDFIFQAFKAADHQANLLPWLARLDLGLTSTKISLLKYLVNEEFQTNPSSAAYGFNPKTFLISIVCDMITNPLYCLGLLQKFFASPVESGDASASI